MLPDYSEVVTRYPFGNERVDHLLLLTTNTREEKSSLAREMRRFSRVLSRRSLARISLAPSALEFAEGDSSSLARRISREEMRLISSLAHEFSRARCLWVSLDTHRHLARENSCAREEIRRISSLAPKAHLSLGCL